MCSGQRHCWLFDRVLRCQPICRRPSGGCRYLFVYATILTLPIAILTLSVALAFYSDELFGKDWAPGFEIYDFSAYTVGDLLQNISTKFVQEGIYIFLGQDTPILRAHVGKTDLITDFISGFSQRLINSVVWSRLRHIFILMFCVFQDPTSKLGTSLTYSEKHGIPPLVTDPLTTPSLLINTVQNALLLRADVAEAWAEGQFAINVDKYHRSVHQRMAIFGGQAIGN
ncbi:hypothetical protein M422DRAFT_42578 [Sphaerobolus stellatus SS14]|uniref:Uncharacterized protein n=1 Tax=Sphaerobolus stellatus (strain SS14) TaxID=990650 RepID=A0A0C9UWE8_SPHS4|nr:hypothetical protein M422DRAFT_54078 [Sphaerobolus stellatus SS14]KIJ54430.1 hypothetical protein M422DRAFT_42578 [Sphaerobolus stellatus SS14]